MRFLKAIFNLPFILNVAVGVGLLVGLIFGLRSYLKSYTRHDTRVEIPDISKLSLFDALPLLQNAGLKYEIDSFKFDDKYDPYTIFDVYPAIGSEVKLGRRVFIRANPKTWAPVEVPQLKDRYKNNAFRLLEQVGLKVGDTIFEPHKYDGMVLRMMYNNRMIKPGQLVPKFSKIDLVIGSRLQQNVPMVDVTGMTLEDAQHTLEQNYFEVGRIDQRDVLNKDAKETRVFYQSPSAGEIYDQGESVILFMSDQPMEDLQERIAELNGIYRKTIRTDSAGGLNYDYRQRVGSDISDDVRRQIRDDVDESTSRGERSPEPSINSNPRPNTNPQEGIVVDDDE